MEIYGFAMLDIGHNFNTINPNWFDTMRVTKLPSEEGQFGKDHNAFAGVRQSRLGVRSTTPTSLGDLKTTFEFELFGTGVDEGQTTFRLRHAYGEVGKFGAGQTWSPFMDPNVFPNSLEYLGPDRDGVLPERPGALDAHSGRFEPHPGPRAAGRERRRRDLLGPRRTAEHRLADAPAGLHGPVHAWAARTGATCGSPARSAASCWDDLLEDQFDLNGSATGWGINLSSNLKLGSTEHAPASSTSSARASRTT